jgi:SsrA-binding protein
LPEAGVPEKPSIALDRGATLYNAPMGKQKRKTPDNVIIDNKRARFDYSLLETFEAGVSLAGWEVKSLRAGKVQLTDSYVLIKDGEAFLLGAQITPLETASTHHVTDPTRTRKLLLKKKELAQIREATAAKGLTCVCTRLYWKGHLVKAAIALAKGKQSHDKRDTQRDRDWQRQKQRVMREAVKQ